MMNDVEFEAWCCHLSLSDEAINEIQKTRSSEPSRLVDGGKKSVSGRFPSLKMGRTIQFESHQNELALIYKLEFDHDVLEYWDQPPTIYLEYLSKSGRRNRHPHTPDFFVIRRNSAGWEECKTEQELLRLTEKSPNRWTRIEVNSAWSCPPGQEYAQQFGLYYAVRSSAEINWIFVENFIWLEDYFTHKALEVKKVLVCRIQALVRAEPGITLNEIYQHVGEATADDLNILIVTRQVFVDLEKYLIFLPEQVKVFADQDTYDHYKLITFVEAPTVLDSRKLDITIGKIIDWDGVSWTIINTGETSITLSRPDGECSTLTNKAFEALARDGKIIGLLQISEVSSSEVEEFWRRASKRDQEVAYSRVKELEPFLNEERPRKELNRTQRRWLSKYLKAEKLVGNGIVGLFPNYQNRGWRRDGIEPEVQRLMEQHVEDHYETVKQESVRHAYRMFKVICHEKGYKPPSYESYRLAINKRPIHEQIEKRMGARAAYSEEDFHWYLYREETPAHGRRPFQICHMDCTLVDVELLSEIMLYLGLDPKELRGQAEMGRAYVITLMDAYSRKVLANYMTFDPPSYRSVMMVLRICVDKWRRLPQIIVVDRGSEFDNVYFDVLLAHYRITKKQRPSAKPRNGSVMECLFGIADQEFWHNLMGNTQIMKSVRQVTKKVDPKNNAVWTLARLYLFFRIYCDEIYDTSPHPAIRMSPRDTFRIGLERSGLRGHTLISPEEFKYWSMPEPRDRGGQRQVTAKGVKIHYIWYWHESFKTIRRRSRVVKVDVRFDPFDITVAYAYVDGEWVRCRPKRLSELEILSGRSEKEMLTAAEEIRRLNKLQGRDFIDVTDKKLAEFFKHVEMAETALSTAWRDAKKKIAIQHWRDVERQIIHALIEESEIEPETNHLLRLLNLPTPQADTTSNHELNDGDFSTDGFDNEYEFDLNIDLNAKPFEPLEVW
ncbi:MULTISPECIES: Mu transposase C-terminal domain-containing protein [Trichocoleus]|uniref:DDE-type integrase/transposase/recombinase n=1 Tax=Trichocoleus desertorum GB2-A4 TaxID=2933944 RepID=A0ABV0JCI2_9CYAN|nr:Mu transposase C-terminal domain-containing protein [Trichocoleus sp. FACHB-46]MBD1864000.1 DDE-type integrase/transposase/recombinase [Trichocoleus sp. FACHB-46]